MDDHDRREITRWLRQRAIPVSTRGGVDQTSDMGFLKPLLQDAKVVGFGEATHGTREFFTVRHRMLEYLVSELGFNVFAIEASYSAAEAVNDYVLGGNGDCASLLSALGFVMWDVEEFKEVLDWLRLYNARHGEARKVRFHGLDIWNTSPGRQRILDYLRVAAPDRLPETEELFAAIARAESRGLVLAHEGIEGRMHRRVHALAQFLQENRAALAAKSSLTEHDEIAWHLRVIEQWIGANLTDELDELLPGLPRVAGLNNLARSRFMAENLAHLMDRDGPGARVVIWAHIYHLGVGLNDARHGPTRNMGHDLRERWGGQYYAFSLELDHGSYLAREWLPDKTLGALLNAPLQPAPKGSLPWHLSLVDQPAFVLDLHAPAGNPVIERWLGDSHSMHMIGWGRRDSPTLTMEAVPSQCFDGIVFVKNTSSTTPTQNAREMVALGKGY
jgi:erythromycin esterase